MDDDGVVDRRGSQEMQMPNQWIAGEGTMDTIREVLQSVTDDIDVPDFANLQWRGDDLLVSIRKGGSSEFVLGLEPGGIGVRVVERSRKVALLHRPFVGAVEELVDRVMRRAGLHKIN
jgi:hypothetical protein